MKNKEKIDILMIGSSFSVKGGISAVIKQFLNYNWDDNIQIKYIPTYIESNSLGKVIFFIQSVVKIVSHLILNKVDIVHIHMSHTGSFYRKYILLKISKLFGTKVIIHLHGSEFKKFYDSTNKTSKILIKDMLIKSDKFIVLGENWYKAIKSIEENTNIKILFNTVEIPDDTVKYNNNGKKVLFLGSLVKRKGIFELVEVIRNLKDKSILDKYNVEFIIGGSGKEESNLKRKILDYNLERYINLAGWVDGKKKDELIKNSDIFVLPSHNEGLPVAILEAMSYGLPIISTNVGSINEAVFDNKNGFLVDAFDVDNLEKALSKIIISEDLWKRLSKNSKEIIKMKFDESKYFYDIKLLYEGLLSE